MFCEIGHHAIGFAWHEFNAPHIEIALKPIPMHVLTWPRDGQLSIMYSISFEEVKKIPNVLVVHSRAVSGRTLTPLPLIFHVKIYFFPTQPTSWRKICTCLLGSLDYLDKWMRGSFFLSFFLLSQGHIPIPFFLLENMGLPPKTVWK